MVSNFTRFLAQAQKNNILAHDSNLDYKIFDYQVLTQSLGGVDVPIISISNNINKINEQPHKQIIVIASRVHPGETNTSYILHGLIKFLVSTDKLANMLRDKFIFKIIPMINPDGAIVGNNRSSLLGKDMNR